MNNKETEKADREKDRVSDTPKKVKSTKKGDIVGNVAYGTGGFVAGVVSGMTGNALASVSMGQSETMLEVELEDDIVLQNEEIQVEPSPENVLLATNEGVHVAQVNDDVSFSEAFADARAQVGAGGVFEWRGQVYGTYYEDEWNQMSTAERARFQSKIDYQSVIGESTDGNIRENTVIKPTVQETAMASNMELVDDQPITEEVRVLGMETMVNDQGNPILVVDAEIEGRQAVLMDGNNDGTIDVMWIDDNQDGCFSSDEVYNVSEFNVTVDDLQQKMAVSQSSNLLLADNDGLPDYVNDADVCSMV